MADVNEYRVPDKAPEPPPSRNEAQDSRVDAGLPASIDAEKTILGAILLSNESFLEASEKLKPDDFSLDSHQRIFQRMADLMDDQRAVDIVTLAEELRKNKEVETIGGVAYLASLTEGLPRRPVIEEYIRIVKDKATLRRLMSLASATITRAADQSETALAIIVDHAAKLQEITEGGIHRGLVPAAELSVEVMDKFLAQSILTQSPGLSFGVPLIDEATGGIQEGEQVVIGCFSGVGKTTLLAQIVAANCPRGHPISLFLIEPTRHDFLRRLWSIVGNVRYTAATKPWLASRDERNKLMWAQDQVAEWQLYILDNSNLYLDEQLAHQRLAMNRLGIELSAIDYLQRMKVKKEDKGDDVRLKMGRASTANADLVKGTKCRSVILSQLNRSGGMNTLPTMDRLRESGQIENDAATIVMLHLKYDEEQGHFTDEGAAIIPKQRFGVPTSVPLKKDPDTALWIGVSKNNTSDPIYSQDEDVA